MKILHSKIIEGHNVNSEIEGAYRIKGFTETVSTKQLRDRRTLAEHYTKLTHSPRYFQEINHACKSKCEVAEVSLNFESFEAMMASATLAIMAAQENAFAVTRPPGHHASQEKAEGFCFFNNVAIAASYLLQTGQERVCIVDIDGHHGNGTQSIFSKEDRVLFCSIHQSRVYPYTGRANDIGSGPSIKKVINIPLLSGAGDDVFLKSLEFILEQIKVFDPNHIAISAGFDGYSKDRLLGLRYSKQGYHAAGKLLASLGKPVFGVLEGGYHEEVKECANALIAGISGNVFDTEERLTNSSSECVNHNRKTIQTISKLLVA